MKKVVLVVLAVLISVAFVTTVFAQGAKPGTETKPAGKGPSPKDTGAPSVTKEVPAAVAGAAKVQMYKGAVVSVDDVAKTIAVKDKKGENTFDVSAAKNVPKLKAGDQVSFQYIANDDKPVAGNFYKKGTKAPAKGKQEALSAGAPEPEP